MKLLNRAFEYIKLVESSRQDAAQVTRDTRWCKKLCVGDEEMFSVRFGYGNYTRGAVARYTHRELSDGLAYFSSP